MKQKYYEVVGIQNFVMDLPGGDSRALPPKSVFKARPGNVQVVRGLRTKRLRELSQREAEARRALEVSQRAKRVRPNPHPVVTATQAALTGSKSKDGSSSKDSSSKSTSGSSGKGSGSKSSQTSK